VVRTAFNIRELVRQLGVKDVSELPLVESIQPTLQIGDAGAITQPLMPPTALLGGSATGNGTTTVGGGQIVPAPSGTWVRHLNAVTAITGNILTALVAHPGTTMATTAACAAHQMSVDPIASAVNSVTMLAASRPNPVTSPYSLAAANVAQLWPDLLFVPPGFVLEFTCNSFSAGFGFWCVVQDVAAPNVAPTG
jgi:hypothetical protein